MSEVPEIGLHRDVPESVYHSWPAVSQSRLKPFNKSAAHARHAMLHPEPPTPAQELGRAVHIAILEPARFESQYVEAPQVDRRTKVGKAEWAAFDAEHATATLLKPDDFAMCIAMRDAAWEHPLASVILSSQGMREVSAVWTDGETGLLCKARPDLLCRWDSRSVIVDVKTTRDASPEGFGREALKYGYDAQLAFYRSGLANLAPMVRGALIVAIEKDAPYCIGVYAVPAEVLELGARKYRRWLTAYAEAEKTDVWAGYPAELMNLELPRWAWTEETTDGD